MCNDGKYGKLKYMALLQKAVNNQVDMITIELDDVEMFCKKEALAPDSDMGDSRAQLLQSIEQLVGAIELHVPRYQGFFYEICDIEQPARDENYTDEASATRVRNAVQDWRERLNAKDAAGGLDKAMGVPAKLKNPWSVRFKPRSSASSMSMRQIRGDSVGQLVQLDCLVVSVQQVKPKVQIVTYHCETCGCEVFQSVEADTYTPPKECPSTKCKENKQSGNLHRMVRSCAFTRHEEAGFGGLCGFPRFRQRLLHEHVTLEDEVLLDSALDLLLVLLPFRNVKPGQGSRDLWRATCHGDVACVERILQQPQDPDGFDHQGKTPLLGACANDLAEVVGLLLEAGADRNRAATVRANGTVLRRITPLGVAAHEGHMEIAQLLLQAGADPDKAALGGTTPLHMACNNGHLEVARLLLEAGADKDKAVSDTTSLGMASRGGHLAIVRLLLEAKADKDKVGRPEGMTPIWLASREGQAEIVQMLLLGGADKSKVCGPLHAAPLWVACRQGHLEIARLLVEAGAVKDQAASDGTTPAEIGRRNGYPTIAKLLWTGELVKVQELAEHVPAGGIPRTMTVQAEGDLTRMVKPGQSITLTGVFFPQDLPYVMRMRQQSTQKMFIEAHHFQKHKSGYSETVADEGALENKIAEAKKRGSLYEAASKSIAPEIFGHQDLKKALLLVLIGAPTKQMKDGLKIRGDIHTLMMGDPGVAKSQLLKQVTYIAPRSVYTSGKGSSSAGLTASVNRDNSTGDVTLEGGALVMADCGVCCILALVIPESESRQGCGVKPPTDQGIDEFDKMDEKDRTAIHEVMEQQTISIAKAGVTTTLNCRTTVLAAANPVYGRYNPYKSPVENIDLPAALLSRFDLVFLLLDTVDGDRDKQLSKHVADVRSKYQKQEADDNPNADADDVLNLGFKPFDHKTMRAYIKKAKSFDPFLDKTLLTEMCDAYVSIRDDEKRDGLEAKKSYTTPRTLLAIARLSQAHARARFSERVERQDFEEAMRLMKASKESIELSMPAKRGENPMNIVYDIIVDLSRRDAARKTDGWVELAHVVSMAGHKALPEELVLEAVNTWCSLSAMNMNPEKTMIQFAVPEA
ncbi:MCM7 [Symbiodinium sp. CCMP2592]|nr:MCM7 [Symbiodinium sp. CCMP2592]